MKVLFVTHYSELLGANRAMITLIKNLIGIYSIDAKVVLPSKGPLCEELKKLNVEYYVIPMHWWMRKTCAWDSGFVRFLDYCNKQRRNVVNVLKHYRTLRSEKFDLVYSNSVVINTGWIISSFLRIPHIWHFRESLAQFEFRFPHLLGSLILKNNCTKFFILISDFLLQTYKTMLPLKRVVRIYDGVQPMDIVQDNINEYPASSYNICVVGAVAEQKNQMDVINAISVLRGKGINVKLHLVGPIDEDYKKECEKMIVGHHMEDCVIFYGMQNNVSDIVRKMDVCIMPSRDEAFGLVTVEYMLQKKPIIASKSGANEELIIDGVNGLCYNLFDYEQLATLIEIVLNDKNLLKQYGEAGYNMALNNFSATKNAQNIYSVFKDALNDSKQ